MVNQKKKIGLFFVIALVLLISLGVVIHLYDNANTRNLTSYLGFNYDVSVMETRWDEEENLWFIRVQSPEVAANEPFWLPVQTKPVSFGQRTWSGYYADDVSHIPQNQVLPMILFTLYYDKQDLSDAVKTYSEEYNLLIPEGFVESLGTNDLVLLRKMLLLKMTEADWAKENVRVIDVQVDY